MFEQAFKNIDDVLWKEPDCSSELDYTERTSWLLFLKYLDDLKVAKAMEAELRGNTYEPVIAEKFRCSKGAAPKVADDNFDHYKAIAEPNLIEYVDDELMPQLFGQVPTSTPLA